MSWAAARNAIFTNSLFSGICTRPRILREPKIIIRGKIDSLGCRSWVSKNKKIHFYLISNSLDISARKQQLNSRYVVQKPKCTKVIWKIKTNLRWNVVKIGKNYLEQANWWELLFWLKRASLVYDILFDSFLDFLSFLYVGVKKDPGRVLGHYYMTQETAECIPCKIITQGLIGQTLTKFWGNYFKATWKSSSSPQTLYPRARPLRQEHYKWVC